MKTLYGDATAMTRVNGYDNQFNRVFVRDKLQYESEPLVTGYYFLSFSLPQTLSNPGGEYSQINYSDANRVLNSVNTSITLPDISITQVTVDGLGGTWNTVPGRLDIAKTFNVKYWETFSGEVTATIRSWLFQLRDPRSGASRIKNAKAPLSTSTNYTQQKYKGQLWWWMTDPTIDRAIFAMEYLGIWPTNLPLSSINQDVATNDKVEIEITFAYDRPFFYPSTVKFCAGANFLQARYQEMLDIDSDKGDQNLNPVAGK